MKKGVIVPLVVSVFHFWINPVAHASSDQSWIQDRKSILTQAGCYRVTYHFKETASLIPNYPTRSPEYHEQGIEWIDAETSKRNPNKIQLQHILMTPHGPLKHWSQTWIYQPRSMMIYSGNSRWEKISISQARASGKWVQQVYQVDGSPRYGCMAPWTHDGLKDYWECQTWSPLPRRELTQRNDYQVLNRTNHHEITPTGWVHLQDNQKIQLEPTIARIIALEDGTDTYTRIDSSYCQEAREWWDKNQPIWKEIHQVWDEVYLNSNSFQLKASVNQKTLWERLFEIAHSGEDIRNQTQKAIQEFLEP